MSGLVVIPFADGGGAGPAPPLPTPPIPPKGGPPPPATAKPNVTSVRSPNDGVEQAGSELWLRKWELSVGNPSGSSAMDLSLLDFEFHVDRQWQLIPPAIARIKIYNPNEAAITGMSKELTKVHLKAGYQTPWKQFGDLFNGQINYFKFGRQNATDTFVEIFASEFDTAVNAAVVNTWLPAGWVQEDAINAVLSAMTPYGITLGQMPDLDKTKHPRGRLFFGMARDHLRDIERTQRGRFFIDGYGKLHLLKDDEALKMGNESIPVLNRKTGLIDIPTRTLDGAVEMQCLLNPNVKPGGRVKINNKDVTSATRVDVTNLVADAYKISESERLYADDGIYVVAHVKHQGQTRGNPWYSHMTTQKSLPDIGIRTSAGG